MFRAMSNREGQIRVVRFVLIVSVVGLAAAVALGDTGLVIVQFLVIVMLALMIYALSRDR
jgi:hypothetical protein